MANQTLTGVANTFPAGTTVSAVRRVGTPNADVTAGVVVATAAVADAGTLAFTGLTAGEKYYASATVSGANRHVAFEA